MRDDDVGKDIFPLVTELNFVPRMPQATLDDVGRAISISPLVNVSAIDVTLRYLLANICTPVADTVKSKTFFQILNVAIELSF